MKIVSFRQGARASWGVWTDAGIADLGQHHPSLRAALVAGGLDAVRRASQGAKATVKHAEAVLLPPIGDAEKILCIGLNYEEHRKETGRDPSAQPTIFTRFNESQVGHGQPMVRPKASTDFDYEGELAVIVGKAGRHIAEKDALAHVAGYSCYNDGSIRDWQRHTTQFTPGKNFTGTGGFGPWMVTADEIPDPKTMRLQTRLNGQVVQDATTDLMIFDIPFLIRYCSTFTTLRPGDVIVTGTPGGVGMKRSPPLWMKPGDTVEVDISKVGVLRNPIVQEE